MFNIKRLFFLLVLIVSFLFSLQNVKIVFSVLKEMLSGKDFSILLLAWPLILGWLIYASILIYLVIFSWKKMQEIDKVQISKSGISALQAEQKIFGSFKTTPIIKLGLYFAVSIILVSIFIQLSK